jgi:hypothetical protein
MGHITIYLEDAIEKKMAHAAQSVHISQNQWLTQLIQERLHDTWSETITSLAGSWHDFPDLEELRRDLVTDSRENF